MDKHTADYYSRYYYAKSLLSYYNISGLRRNHICERYANGELSIEEAYSVAKKCEDSAQNPTAYTVGELGELSKIADTENQKTYKPEEIDLEKAKENKEKTYKPEKNKTSLEFGLEIKAQKWPELDIDAMAKIGREELDEFTQKELLGYYLDKAEADKKTYDPQMGKDTKEMAKALSEVPNDPTLTIGGLKPIVECNPETDKKTYKPEDIQQEKDWSVELEDGFIETLENYSYEIDKAACEKEQTTYNPEDIKDKKVDDPTYNPEKE